MTFALAECGFHDSFLTQNVDHREAIIKCHASNEAKEYEYVEICIKYGRKDTSNAS